MCLGYTHTCACQKARRNEDARWSGRKPSRTILALGKSERFSFTIRPFYLRRLLDERLGAPRADLDAVAKQKYHSCYGNRTPDFQPKTAQITN